MSAPNPNATMDDNWREFHASVTSQLVEGTQEYANCRMVFMAGQISLHTTIRLITSLPIDEARPLIRRLRNECNRESHLAMFSAEACPDPNCPACAYIRNLQQKLGGEGGNRG